MVRRVAALCLLVACVFSFQHAARAADWMTGIATFTGSEVSIYDARRCRTLKTGGKRRICGPEFGLKVSPLHFFVIKTGMLLSWQGAAPGANQQKLYCLTGNKEYLSHCSEASQTTY